MESEYQTAQDIFECKLCGDCCKGFGGTYISSEDILNISSCIHSDPDKFIDQYCDPSGSRHVLTRGEDGKCIFFDSVKQCTIHPVKPYMCKAWPFIAAVIKAPENWDIMANSCPGIKKGVPHETLIKIVGIEKDKLDNIKKQREKE